MPNGLSMGTRRTGSLIDFDPDTPHVHVVLERSSKGIRLTVPWSGPDSPYSAWFGASAYFQEGDASAGQPSPPFPRRLLFQDSHGPVMLIGCWPSGYHSNLFGPGTGVLTARAAVLGTAHDVDFENPQGLESEVSGLRDWLKLSSWRDETTWATDHVSAKVSSIFVPPILVGEFGPLTLEMRPTWKLIPERANDRLVLLDTVAVRSSSAEPLMWNAHLDLHRSLRDLLVLSRWWKESCVVNQVARFDDRVRTSDDKDHGHHWRAVVVADDERQHPPSSFRPHLIEYEDLGSEGVGQWITLRDEFARALDPVLSSIELNATPTTLLAQAGPGLEALGFLLMRRDGDSLSTARKSSLAERLARVWDDVGQVLPIDGEQWISQTVTTYNGLKHANRRLPVAVDLANAWRESVFVARAWTAIELGVTPEALAPRLEEDPQRHPYVART